jgi:hypothetical protein
LQQSIGALAAGQGGNTGGGVPTGAILNLLGSLANNAAYEAESVDGDLSDGYLRDAHGQLLVDPSSPSERAAVVWDRLSARAPAGSDESEDEPDDVEWIVGTGIGRRV